MQPKRIIPAGLLLVLVAAIVYIISLFRQTASVSYVSTVTKQAQKSTCTSPVNIYPADSMIVLPVDLAKQSIDSQVRCLIPIIESKSHLYFTNGNINVEEVSSENLCSKFRESLQKKNLAENVSIEEKTYRHLVGLSPTWNLLSSLANIQKDNIPCFIDQANKKVYILQTNDQFLKHLLLVKSLFLYLLNEHAGVGETAPSHVIDMPELFKQAASNVFVSSYLTQIAISIEFENRDSVKQDPGYTAVSSDDIVFGGLYLSRIQFLEAVIVNQLENKKESYCSMLDKFTANRFEMDDFDAFSDMDQWQTINRLDLPVEKDDNNYVLIGSMGHGYWSSLTGKTHAFPKPANELVLFDKTSNSILVQFVFESKLFSPADAQIDKAKSALMSSHYFDTIIHSDHAVLAIKDIDSPKGLNVKRHLKQVGRLEKYLGKDTLFFKPITDSHDALAASQVNDGERMTRESAVARMLASLPNASGVIRGFYGPG